MSIHNKLGSRLLAVFENARDFFLLLASDTDEPHYHLISQEYASGLDLIPSLLGDEDRITDPQKLLEVRGALEWYRDALGNQYLLQARQVSRLLDDLDDQEFALSVREEVA